MGFIPFFFWSIPDVLGSLLYHHTKDPKEKQTEYGPNFDFFSRRSFVVIHVCLFRNCFTIWIRDCIIIYVIYIYRIDVFLFMSPTITYKSFIGLKYERCFLCEIYIDISVGPSFFYLFYI